MLDTSALGDLESTAWRALCLPSPSPSPSLPLSLPPSLQGLRVGVSLAVAIALHNIPEGLAVALPIYFATRSRWKAFSAAALSGLAEPLGVVVVAIFFPSSINPDIVEGLLAGGRIQESLGSTVRDRSLGLVEGGLVGG